MANSTKTLLTHGYGLFAAIADNTASFTLFFIRLCFGWELFISGRGHLQNVDAMVHRFIEWHIPFPHVNVYLSAFTEMIGGLLMLFGLFSRLMAVPLTFNFIVAYLTASRDTLVHLLEGPDRLKAIDDFTGDAAFFFLVAALVIVAFGPGRISLDYLLSGKFLKAQQKTIIPTEKL